MYVQVVILSLIFASIVAGVQSFVLTNASTWRAHRIDRLLDTQIGAARENFRSALAARVQSVGPRGPFSLHASTPVSPVCPPLPLGATQTATPCPYQVSMQASVVGDTTQTTTDETSAYTPELVTANNLQTASFVDEQRVSAIVTVQLFASDGTTQVGSREELVTARTFNAAPYAVVTGAADLAGSAGLPSEGDSGGCDPLNGTTCSSVPLTDVPGDTRIHAQQCNLLADGSCTLLPSSDAFSSRQWQNPNQTVKSGWRN